MEMSTQKGLCYTIENEIQDPMLDGGIGFITHSAIQTSLFPLLKLPARKKKKRKLNSI